MSQEEMIKLVKLYNRLSFYFCLIGDKPEIKIYDNTTVTDLQAQLDEAYEKYKNKEPDKKVK